MDSKPLKWLKKAQALELAGRALEASLAYKEFLDRQPRHGFAWADYAGQLLKLGRLEEAEQACLKALAIDPNHFAASINLGCIQMRRDCLREAEARFKTVLKTDPSRVDAQLCLVECLLKATDIEQAGKVLAAVSQSPGLATRYAAMKPLCAELWARLGTALFDPRNVNKAEAACQTALRYDPQNLMARTTLGTVHMAQGDLEGAERLFRQSLAGDPRQERVRLLLITCLTRRGDLVRTDQEIAAAIHQTPDSLALHQCILGAHYNRRRWPALRVELERFRKVDPTSAYPDFAQSMVDLVHGDFPRAWGLYEARAKVLNESKSTRSFAQPLWKGEPFAGKTLFLWTEQGLGDTLMGLRFLPQVKALGGQVVLETQPSLLGLAATAPGADRLVPWDAPPVTFDLHASLMSLPWIFQTDLSNLPAEVPYITVPSEVPHRQEILDLLSSTQDTTRIGVVWAGSPNNGRDFERSIAPTALAPLAALPGVSWFSFQLDAQALPPLPGLIPLAPLLGNFSDTALALSGMDLLITVDTAMAHLAGALGIPALVLVSYAPDFRWLLDRDDSPWYPTLRIYRQPEYGDWDSVIRQVVDDLSSSGS